jgi:coenzyme F420-0:L-glutamate ligase/coenzyme F420-1:gamma-L-glutamate ligase
MESNPKSLTLTVVSGIPMIAPGDDLAAIIIDAIVAAGLSPHPGDVVVVAQKIVSKAQGRFIELSTVVPSARAHAVAKKTKKDPQLVEVILSESVRIVRQHPNVLIVEHHNGFIAANAGVDRSNVSESAAKDTVLLLPANPDEAASDLRARLENRFDVPLAVVVSDSFGRPWRYGTVGVALGSAGIESLRDLRGKPDLFGHALEVTETAMADELAAAASLLMGQADEARPVVLISGLPPAEKHIPARGLIRPASEDLFR